MRLTERLRETFVQDGMSHSAMTVFMEDDGELKLFFVLVIGNESIVVQVGSFDLLLTVCGNTPPANLLEQLADGEYPENLGCAPEPDELERFREFAEEELKKALLTAT